MKQIELKNKIIKIETCENCPFKTHDSHYSMSQDSGYDCYFLGRIVNDCAETAYNQKMKVIEKQNKTMFKYDGEIPENPFKIKENCPLKDI